MWSLTEPPADGRRQRNIRIDALLMQMANGDRSALGELYALIKGDLYAYALSRRLTHHEAEDLIHDTFVTIFRAAPRYRSQGKPMAWILTIARNLILEGYRTPPAVPYDEAVGTEEECDTGDAVAARLMLAEQLSVLSEAEREAVVLHAVAGLRHREIAVLLDKPLSTVLSLYRRAIKKLQKHMKEGGEL